MPKKKKKKIKTPKKKPKLVAKKVNKKEVLKIPEIVSLQPSQKMPFLSINQKMH